MADLSRRHFLSSTLAVTAGLAGLRAFTAHASMRDRTPGFGPPIEDPFGIIDLPPGFSYTMLSPTGSLMDDGLLVPAKHDGMGAFPGPDGTTILIRNHELEPAHSAPGGFGKDNALAARVPAAKLFDPGLAPGAPPAGPSRGGTTTLLYDPRTQRITRQWLSLAGTERNCAGGITPRNTWITCEESVVRAGDNNRARDHGWCFEVPATADIALVDPMPIKPMGRFMHEACATDPRTGIVYLTEDRHDGVLYRYIPINPAKLLDGGKLQALAVRGRTSLDTRNWERQLAAPGQSYEVEWHDVEDVESPDDSLRAQMFERGCARFARAEGMWHGRDAVYFACTNGGKAFAGQIWRHTPSADPDAGGTLDLFIEPNDTRLLENADNITFAPSGDAILCEDGADAQHLIGITPRGEVYTFARNRMNTSEFAGACFSPDGSTLFVNIQNPGVTLAITGPWTAAAT